MSPADPAHDPAQLVNSLTPIWRHIRISPVTSTDSSSAGQIVNAKGIQFVNVQITPKTGPPVMVLTSIGTNYNSFHDIGGDRSGLGVRAEDGGCCRFTYAFADSDPVSIGTALAASAPVTLGTAHILAREDKNKVL